MKSSDELRRLADEFEAKARQLLENARSLRQIADQQDSESAPDSKRINNLALTIRKDSTTLPTNMRTAIASQSSVNIGRGTSKALRDEHPFALALSTHKMTASSWARAHKIKPVTVLSWMNSAAGARKIPLAWATTIERELGVPATTTSWPNGIIS